MRTFPLVLLLTACGSPFSAGAPPPLEEDGAALLDGAAPDGGGDASPAVDDGGSDAGQADSGPDAESAGGASGTGGTGGAPEAGGAASGGAPGGAPGTGGAAGGAPGAGGVVGAGGACEATLCPAVLEDGSDCRNPCCTDDGKCGCSGGACAAVGECTRVMQSICSVTLTYAFKCPGALPPSGCTVGTANTGYPYFCCPKAVYP